MLEYDHPPLLCRLAWMAKPSHSPCADMNQRSQVTLQPLLVCNLVSAGSAQSWETVQPVARRLLSASFGTWCGYPLVRLAAAERLWLCTDRVSGGICGYVMTMCPRHLRRRLAPYTGRQGQSRGGRERGAADPQAVSDGGLGMQARVRAGPCGATVGKWVEGRAGGLSQWPYGFDSIELFPPAGPGSYGAAFHQTGCPAGCHASPKASREPGAKHVPPHASCLCTCWRPHAVQLEQGGEWEDCVDEVVGQFQMETGRRLTYTICYY